MTNLKNNLFNYATKELSQDAFICWLCSFALEDADESDPDLVTCGKKLVYEFMKRGIDEVIDKEQIQLTMVEKQVGNIDVLLTACYRDEIYKIIVEDKTHSSEHDNQLQRYKDGILDKTANIICIYFKTGFQSDLSEVNKAGYKLFGRQDVLKLLEECESNNAILKDYRDYWENFEALKQSYKSNKLGDWPDWQAVNGFYEELQTMLESKGLWAGYNYVSNPSGGFWGFWYGIDEDHIYVNDDYRAALYLQIEMKWGSERKGYDFKICLKLEKQEGDDRETIELRNYILAHQETFGFYRPDRLRLGKQTTTVGVIKGDYSSLEAEDLTGVVLASAEKYKEFLDYIRNNYTK